MRVSRSLSIWAVAMAVGLALVLGGAGHGAATQNGPVWAAGDYWTYRSINNPNVTQTWTVDKTEIVALGSTNYTTWHTWVNTTTTSPSGSSTTTIHEWLTTNGEKLVKTQVTFPFFGLVTVTFNPPQPYAVFPLFPGANWSGSSTVTTTSAFGTTTTTSAWSGQVTSESSLTVPAGTFSAAAARVPATGAPYRVYYYSEAAGWAVKIETYDNNGVLTDTMQLTSYRYTAPSPFVGGTGSPLVWILVILVAAAVALLVVLGLVFRRPRETQPMPPPMSPQDPAMGLEGPPPRSPP